MPNTFEYTDWLTMEGLRILQNKLEVAQFFNTDYNEQFTKEFPVGETVRVPLPQKFEIRTGLGYSPQALEARHTDVTVNDPFGVDFEWDSAEKALKMPRGEERIKRQFLDPAMAKIAQYIDSKCAEWAYQNTNNVVGSLGTNPTTFDATSAAALERMTEMACPLTGELGMILPPAATRAVKTGAITYFNPSSDISRQFRTGSIGKADKFDWYTSMSLKDHTAGTLTSPTISGASQSGSTLTIACTSGDTVAKGDVISIDNVYAVNPMTLEVTSRAQDKQFVITQAQTATGSTMTINISPAIVGPGSVYQNVDALPANGATITLFPGTTSPNGKQGRQGLALHRDAFALVGVKLANPKQSSVELASQTRDPDTGISISFIRAFDPVGRKWINRFDTMIGFGNLYPDNCAVRVLCA